MTTEERDLPAATIAVAYARMMRRTVVDPALPVVNGRPCRLFTGYVTPGGYSQVKVGGRDGRLVLGHRLSWLATHGPIPELLRVCHHCDVRRCLEDAHHFTGTQAENLADMRAKGRWSCRSRAGEANTMARITAAQAQEIRALYEAGGVTQTALGARFGLTQSAVSLIVLRRAWTHVA